MKTQYTTWLYKLPQKKNGKPNLLPATDCFCILLEFLYCWLVARKKPRKKLIKILIHIWTKPEENIAKNNIQPNARYCVIDMLNNRFFFVDFIACVGFCYLVISWMFSSRMHNFSHICRSINLCTHSECECVCVCVA